MKRTDERGFAMLLVFVMAASVAIMLYQELPRVAFEAQRDREALLIERGEQYARAVQLYVRKFNKFPPTMEELEKVNQVRFLRQRYKDPMTDSEEWRIIHVGPGGVFLDSLVHKPPQQEGEQKSVNTFTHESASIGSSGANPNAPAASAVRQARDSERRGMPPMLQSTNAPPPDAEADPNQPVQAQGQPGAGGGVPPSFMPGYNQQQPGGQPNQQGQSQQQPGVAGGVPPSFVPGYNPQQPGQNPYGQQQPVVQTNQNPNPYGQPGFPAGQQQTNQNPFGQQAPVSWQPGQRQAAPQPQPGQPAMVGGGMGAVQQPQQPQTPAAPSFVGGGSSFVGGSASVQPQQPYQPQQPVYQPPAAQQPATQPGGMSAFPSQQPRAPVQQQVQRPGSQGGAGIGQTPNAAASMIQQILTTPRANPMQAGAQGGNQTIGGGIAGVASVLELEGIKVYNDRTAYNEWEFVYDLSKEAAKAAASGGQAGIPGAPGQQQPAQGMQSRPGQAPGGMNPQPNFNFPPGMGAPVRPGR